MKYRCLHNEPLSLNGYQIMTIRREDSMLIKQWRNEQMSILRQNRQLSDEDQESYFRQVVTPSIDEEYPRVILFSFLQGDECIGYGGLTNVDWTSRRAEVSFLLKTGLIHNSVAYSSCFTVFLDLLKKVAFEDIQFNRLFTETYDARPVHIAALEASGFRCEGRMKQHVFKDGTFIDSLIHGYLREYYGQR